MGELLLVVSLDIRILVLFSALAALVQGGLSLIFSMQETGTRALRPIGFSSIVMALALVGMSLQGTLPDFVTIVGAHALVGVAVLLVDRGVRVFQGEPLRDVFGAALVAATMAGTGAIVTVTDDLRPRLFLVSLCGMILHARLALRLRRGVRNSGTSAHRVTEVIFWLFTGVMALRTAAAAVTPAQLGTDSPGLIQLVSLPVGILLISASTLGFWSMEVQRLHRELYKLATTDELTGILNRRAFLTQCERHLTRHQRSGEPVSLLLFDLDHFKWVNDTYGHPVGDEALRHAAQVLQLVVRPGDIVGRFGGEEFALLVPSAGMRLSLEIAERARAALAKSPIHVEQHCIPITCSVGVATFPGDGESLHDLIHAADSALYAAKGAGRDCVRPAQSARTHSLSC